VRGHVDAEFFHDAFGHGAVGSRAFYGRRAAETEAERAADTEFVALGVSTEVVVVVEDENAGFRTGCFAVEVSGGQAANAAADDDQVVGFAGFFGLARRIPECAVAQGVSSVEGTGVAATHAGESGRVIVGRGLGTDGGLTCAKPGGGKVPRHHGRA